MKREEKILLVQLILKDIRGNWGWSVSPRVKKAYSLCKELGGEFDILAERIKSWGREDGRYFRTAFPRGYEGMSNLHNLSSTYNDKSDEFKEASGVLTYPEYRFEDWHTRYERMHEEESEDK